jgi:NAD(P)-dependent dehydrogenase (short-subunit alcohol dehydrogenase family)
MARIIVTGSADGLGFAAARTLLDDGHDVVLHARNDERAGDIRRAEPRAGRIAVGDLSSIAQTREAFYDRRAEEPLAATRGTALQDRLLDYCAGLTGTPLP